MLRQEIAKRLAEGHVARGKDKKPNVRFYNVGRSRMHAAPGTSGQNGVA